MPTKGRTLRVERTRVGVKQFQLADRMGVHRNSVKRYEDLGEVPLEIVQRYRAALASFMDSEATA